VKPRKRKDEGSGLAAIDRESMRELGVSSGEFVAIEGRDGRAIARVWPGRSEDSGRGIVRIDGQLRQAAGASVDGTVEVEPVEVGPAERVVVALPEGLRIRGDLGSYLRGELADRAVSAGDTVPPEVGFGLLSGGSGRRVPVAVVDTDPSGTVVVGNATTVDVIDRAEEVPSTAGEGGESTPSPSTAPTPSVTYEDVDLDDLAERTEDHVGADMGAVCREAAQTAVRGHVRAAATGEPSDVDGIEVAAEDFEAALDSVDPEGESFDPGEPLLTGHGEGPA